MKGIALLAGLGNPGTRYAHNRHNVGFWFVDALNEDAAVKPDYQKKLLGHTSVVQINQTSVRLFKPDVFVNESGKAIQNILKFYQREPSQLLVVHDELDFPVGKVRFKQGGGHGGHNGLRSIISYVGGDFWRLRVGIGHPGHKDRVTSYVLGDPDVDDTAMIQRGLRQAQDVLDDFVSGKFETAMNTLHVKNEDNMNDGI